MLDSSPRSSQELPRSAVLTEPRLCSFFRRRWMPRLRDKKRSLRVGGLLLAVCGAWIASYCKCCRVAAAEMAQYDAGAPQVPANERLQERSERRGSRAQSSSYILRTGAAEAQNLNVWNLTSSSSCGCAMPAPKEGCGTSERRCHDVKLILIDRTTAFTQSVCSSFQFFPESRCSYHVCMNRDRKPPPPIAEKRAERQERQDGLVECRPGLCWTFVIRDCTFTDLGWKMGRYEGEMRNRHFSEHPPRLSRHFSRAESRWIRCY
jgi:hypothetical protein